MRATSIATRLTLAATLFAACLATISSAQEARTIAEDAELTRNLISQPGATFRVPAHEFPAHWNLIAYGDQRFTDPANEKVTNPKVRRWLVSKIAAEHPDALLLSGDVPYDGSVANDYAVYRQESAPWRDAGLRVYPAMGNHELHGEEVQKPANWWKAFPELQDRRWYSVEGGNLYIVTVDSNLSLLPGSRQRAWLDDQLAHLPAATRYLFVSLHHPPVADSILNNHSHDVRPNEHELALLLEKTAANSKAQIIVAAGHIHNYERFFENGVTYLVSGGGGAKPVPIARTAADKYQSETFPNYHYVKFTFDGHQLQATMIRVKNPESATPEWETGDQFTIPVKP